MAEQLKRDQNHVTVQGAVTDDSNQTVEMWRADATTKRLLVSAVVAGSQNGKILVDGADTTYEYLATKLVAGTGITLTVINPGGNETLEISSVGSIYYNIVQEDGVSVTQRTKLNFVNYFSINDNAGNTSTDVNLNIGAIESALDLANIGGQINLATQVTGLLSSTNIDITDLESNLDLANIAGSIDLSTQVTGTLDVSNIDVVGIANDATFLATLIPNLDENVKVAVDGVTITGDGTTSNPLVAAVSSDNFTVKATAADNTPSELDNKVNIHSTDGSVTVTKTITNPAGNEIVDYDLSINGGSGTFAKRITTKVTAVLGGGPTTFVVPHGLGTTPSEMNIEGKRLFGTTEILVSSGYSDFSGIDTCIGQDSTGGVLLIIDSSSECLYITHSGGFIPMTFTATADATNITLSSYTPNGIAEELYLIIDLFI